MSRLGRYNLTRYNTPETSQKYRISLDLYATVIASFGVQVQIAPLLRMTQTLTGSARLRWGYVYAQGMTAALTASARLRRLWSPRVMASQDLDLATGWELLVWPKVAALTELDAVAAPGSAYYRRQTMAAALSAVMPLVADIHPAMDAGAALNAQFSIESQIDTVLSFADLTLPAGARLVIDTENCTATLILADGSTSNVLRYYSGDWPWISRLLRGISVTAMTSGALDVRVMYRERYL